MAIPHPLGRATHGVFARRSSAFVVLPLIENPSGPGGSQEPDFAGSDVGRHSSRGCQVGAAVRTRRSHCRRPRPRIPPMTLQLGRPVQIEPGLWRKSPENGNYSMNGQRLSAFSAGNFGNRESGDRLPNCKSPPLAGFSAIS
jgi:hypothetical protein